MAAPSMVSRDGEHTLVKSLDAVFGASEDEGDDNNSNPEDEGSQNDGSGEEADVSELPQCKIKRNYTCSLCDYYTQNPRFYLYHQKQVHKEKIKIFECPHCLYASKHSQKLQRHIHMVHVMGKKKLSKAKVRLMKKAAKMRKATPPTPPPAPPPPTSFPSPPEEEEHEETMDEMENMESGDIRIPEPPIFGIDGLQVFKCSVCHMLSKSESLIAKHERVVHMKKRFFRCNKCNYMTHMKARYTKHVKYHSMPMIKCDMCDFKTPYKWNLDRHNKNHLGDGAFKCMMCNFAADIKQSLTVHEMNHHVPPVGHMAGNRRKLRVGASDTMGMLTEEDGIDDDELDLLRLEREGSLEQMDQVQNPGDFLQTQLEEPLSPSPPPIMKLSMRQVLVPVGKMPFDKNLSPGLIHIQKYKCKHCDFSGNLGEVQRHESSVHGGYSDLEGLGKKQVVAKRPIPNLIPIQGQSVLKPPSERKIESEGMANGSKSSSSSPTPSDPQETFKRKNASFFDKLKEKLMTSATDRDLTCGICGYEASCLSDHLKHHKSHEEEGVSLPGELSSTRCQHCRHRCKTSSDLLLHLQTCPMALSLTDNALELKKHLINGNEMEIKEEEVSEPEKSAHPMENKVFVWNNFNPEPEQRKPSFEMKFYQPRVEEREAPPPVSSSQQIMSNGHIEVNHSLTPKETTRKVFKCPNCSFWASTASRFHVHIVGHLNKRPFQCSLCHYSSNWRWDITKHIRLKQMRDAAHEKARVLLTDEAGRRNYSKYNKYLIPISIEEFKRAQVPRRGNITKENSDPCERKVVTSKRPAEESNEPDDERPKKKPFSENKKTMWKCKKCLFRNSDRAVVLAHVKDHYRTLAGGKPTFLAHESQNEKNKANQKQRHQASEQLSHNDDDDDGEKGENQTFENEEFDEAPPPSEDDEEDENTESPEFMCETCPFSCDTLQKLEQHAEKHFVSQKTNIKCQFCPFYADNSQELLQHLDLHLDQNPDSSDSMKNVVFACLNCPYVASSRKQLVYHGKWHKKDYDHKCFKCDYSTHTNITLSLHVRLHGRGLLSETPGDSAQPSQPPTETEQNPILLADISGIDTSKNREIPMVWVSKPMGISKMFKCRFCPHVNMRKTNIQEHEKMHSPRADTSDSGNYHRCLNCNYICNNAGVLSSHLKVHQAFFGQVCGIVDHKKPDEEQIDEMKTKVAEYEASIKAKINSEESIPEEIKEEDLSSASVNETDSKEGLVLHFCPVCPARFLFLKEITIHLRFHDLNLPFKCKSCSYTARQKQHLLAHMKVHSDNYTERTSVLCTLYPIDINYPKPRIAVVLGEPQEVSWKWKNESVWVVVDEESKRNSGDDLKENEMVELKKKKPLSCNKCPAEFFKGLALSYHLSLHGGPGPHKCKYCDYAVKTYGNLLRHEALHSKSEPSARQSLKPGEAPHFGTEHFKQKSEVQKGSPQKNLSPPTNEDPEFGSLIFGNPDFVYPTYVKNGKIRDKNYKCHKCPSAFEKREHYKIHLSLHGSRQRYSCDQCDYSVKYLANYSQHMKKHGYVEALKKYSGGIPVIEEKDEEIPEPAAPQRSAKSLKMSIADQQTTLIMQARNISGNRDNINSEAVSRCPHCPYAINRKDGLATHIKCHSNTRGAYTCKYCDYNVPQPHFLREHLKVHFSSIKFRKPDSYMKCDRLEIWSEPLDSNHNSEKTLVFRDTGKDTENRFLPKIEDSKDFETMKGRVYINLKTGEEEIETDEEEEGKTPKFPLENGTYEKSEGERSLGEEGEGEGGDEGEAGGEEEDDPADGSSESDEDSDDSRPSADSPH